MSIDIRKTIFTFNQAAINSKDISLLIGKYTIIDL